MTGHAVQIEPVFSGSLPKREYFKHPPQTINNLEPEVTQIGTCRPFVESPNSATGEADVVALYVRDEAASNIVVMTLVASLTAIFPCQLDPIALDLIDSASAGRFCERV